MSDDPTDDLKPHDLYAPPGNRAALIELEKQTYDIAFETALEHIADGMPLSQFCANYHQPLSATRFRTWMFKDRRRKEAYLAAKVLAAEAVEDELIRIADGLKADGTPTPDDTTRSKLMIDTRWKMLQVWNRQRYGDTKFIEQTTTQKIDVNTMSKDELEQRLLRAMGIDPDDITPSGDTFDHD